MCHSVMLLKRSLQQIMCALPVLTKRHEKSPSATRLPHACIGLRRELFPHVPYAQNDSKKLQNIPRSFLPLSEVVLSHFNAQILYGHNEQWEMRLEAVTRSLGQHRQPAVAVAYRTPRCEILPDPSRAP